MLLGSKVKVKFVLQTALYLLNNSNIDTLPDTWFRHPFWDLLVLQLSRPDSSNLPCLYSTFHLEYPLVLSQFCFTYNDDNLHKFSL